MSNNKNIDSEKLTDSILETLLKDPAVAQAVAGLQRAVVALSDELVKKITKNFITQIIAGIESNINSEQVSEAAHQAEENIEQNDGNASEIKSEDWSKLSNQLVRSAYIKRKVAGRPIEAELNEELARRFPGYDKEKQDFIRPHAIKEWSKLSDSALRQTYIHRISDGKPIEPELNDELARRFPGYDKDTHSFGKTDWSKSSKLSLRQTYTKRVNNGKPIKPELNEELARRFPNYDKETQTFGKFSNSVPKDLSILTDNALRSLYKYRTKIGRNIEPDLNEELAKRFPGYDKEKQQFVHRSSTVFSGLSDLSLRNAHKYRKKIGKPIEPELNEELARRFSGYDKETQSFGNNKAISGIKSERKTSDAVLHKQTLSETTKKGAQSDLLFPLFVAKDENYSLLFDGRNRPLLRGALAPYELYVFDEKTGAAVVRKKTGPDSYVLYLVNVKNGSVPELSRSGVKNILYDYKRHSFYLPRSGSMFFTEFYGADIIGNVYKLPLNVDTLRASKSETNTVIIDKNGKETFCALMEIADKDGMLRQNKIIKHLLDTIENKPQNQSVVENKNAVSEKVATDSAILTEPVIVTPAIKPDITVKETEIKYKNLVVTIEPVKLTLDGAYNNVYINGKKLLNNHVNTSVKVLCDGTLLAIHGVVTDNRNYPTTPLWFLYDTELRFRLPEKKQCLSDYYVYIKNILDAGNVIKAELSDKTTYLIDAERMKKKADNKRFVIGKNKDKTK